MGESVNEEAKYKPKYEFKKCESDVHPLIDELAERCKKQQELPDACDSLREACREFDRIRTLSRS